MAARQPEAGPSLRPSPPPEQPKDDLFSWLSLVAFLFLTFNTAIAVRRSSDDPSAVAFAGVSWLDFICLLWCLRRFERADKQEKGWLKLAVWLLSSLLTGLFSYKVAAVMPWPVAAILWGLNCVITTGGFYAFFVHGENSRPVQEGEAIIRPALNFERSV